MGEKGDDKRKSAEVRKVRKIEFTCALSGRGWLRAHISDGMSHADLSASYGNDALWILVRSVNALLGTAEAATCPWREEPGEYRWLLERRGEDLTITILWFDQEFPPLPDEKGTIAFSTECRLLKFAIQVKTQLRQLLERHGASEYQALWKHPFPLDEYEKLQRCVREWTVRDKERPRRDTKS
jgi:hypothetical protein